MLPNEDDARTIQAVQEGDGGAFRALVDRHGGTVYSVLRRLVGDASLAEELAQETFVKAYTAIQGFRGESSARTWLVQIAVNLVRDRWRAKQRAAPLVSIERFEDRSDRGIASVDSKRGSDPLQALERNELMARLESELLKLPDKYREVFVLKHIEDLSYETIAQMTGDSVGTLKVRAHRSRMKLRKRLSSGGEDAEEDHGRDSGALSGR